MELTGDVNTGVFTIDGEECAGASTDLREYAWSDLEEKGTSVEDSTGVSSSHPLDSMLSDDDPTICLGTSSSLVACLQYELSSSAWS